MHNDEEGLKEFSLKDAVGESALDPSAVFPEKRQRLCWVRLLSSTCSSDLFIAGRSQFNSFPVSDGIFRMVSWVPLFSERLMIAHS